MVMLDDKLLVLTQVSPGRRKFVLSGATHFGRGTHEEWAVSNRRRPSILPCLETAIHIDSEYVSRNQAAIVKQSDGFYLTDLGSANGTYLNGNNINPNPTRRPGALYRFFGLQSDRTDQQREAPKVKLTTDDKIHMGGNYSDIEFLVSDFIEKDRNHHALLVGHDGGNLKGVSNDLDFMSVELSRRGYAGNIARFRNGEASPQNIKSALDEVSYVATADTRFVFHYSGHGGRKGLDLGRKSLNPEDLYSVLEKMKGKSLVILDNCHAGIFLKGYEGRIPRGTMVIAASSPTGEAYETPSDMAAGKYMGKLTEQFLKYLQSTSGPINVQTFRKVLERKFPKDAFHFRYQEPVLHGNDGFTMMQAIASRYKMKGSA